MADPTITLQQLKDSGVDVLDLQPGRLLVLTVDGMVPTDMLQEFRKNVIHLLREQDLEAPVLVLTPGVTAQVLNLAKEDDA